MRVLRLEGGWQFPIAPTVLLQPMVIGMSDHKRSWVIDGGRENEIQSVSAAQKGVKTVDAYCGAKTLKNMPRGSCSGVKYT